MLALRKMACVVGTMDVMGAVSLRGETSSGTAKNSHEHDKAICVGGVECCLAAVLRGTSTLSRSDVKN